MVVVTIKMFALPAKRKELLQTLQGLMNVFQKETGFLRAQLWAETEDKNIFTLFEEWETQDDVDRYMQQSEYFRVLLGAQQLLTTSSEITFDVVSPPEEAVVSPPGGIELIQVVPGDSEETCEVVTKVKRFWKSLPQKFSLHK